MICPFITGSETGDIFLSARETLPLPIGPVGAPFSSSPRVPLETPPPQLPAMSSWCLMHRQRLAAVILHCLVEFWTRSPPNRPPPHHPPPPFWLIYHLAGHPCVRLRKKVGVCGSSGVFIACHRNQWFLCLLLTRLSYCIQSS